jgi:monofunctional biosynthetic peptidoglycan transglycosylase
MKRIWSLFRIVVLVFFGSTILTTLLYKFINPPLTPLMILRVVQQIRDDESIKIKKRWVSIEDISPNLIQSAVAAEDQLFLEHNGFDIEAIEKAYKHNEKSKRKRGASTISQQTAKNVFLYPSRSWIRKGLEVYFTGLIELLWSKKRIMEVYLNVIEMGDGIYGAEKASNIYFNKKASKLSLEQAALITAILPNPIKFNPLKPTTYLIRRKNIILKRMNQIGNIKF